jgi:hypothetical protein
MSIDSLARRAGDQARSATTTVDIERALAEVTTVRPALQRRRQLTTVAAVAALIVAGTATVASLDDRTPPADPVAPSQKAIGADMHVPVELDRAPSGWWPFVDDTFVVLRPRNGLASTINIAAPTLVHEPPSYTVKALDSHLAAWLADYPALTVSRGKSVVVDGYTGESFHLKLRHRDVPAGLPLSQRLELVHMSDMPFYGQLALYPGPGTCVWTIVDVDGQEVLIALASGLPADKAALHDYRQVLDTVDLG